MSDIIESLEAPDFQLKNENSGFIEKNGKIVKRIFAGIFLVFFVVIGIFFLYQYKVGSFKDADTFKDYINSFGYFGPIVLTLFQCLKVFYAVIPGTIGCIAGPMLFGTVGGAICNYIGICTGSILAFLLSKKFGFSLLRMMFSEKKINSYQNKVNRWMKHYHIFLWIAICSPIAPDDFLCYFSGLTQMRVRKFVFIILTAKPLTIIVYSLIFGNIFN